MASRSGARAERANEAVSLADFDADNDIPIGLDGFDGPVNVEQPLVGRLANLLGEHAGQGDVEEGVNPGPLLLNDVTTQAGERAGAGGPGVNGGRDTARQAGLVGNNTVMGDAPVHVGMEVNETGRHVAPGRIKRLSRLAGQVGANRRDPPILHQHVGRSREVLAGIEYGSHR